MIEQKSKIIYSHFQLVENTFKINSSRFIIIYSQKFMAQVRKTQMRFFVNPILKKFQQTKIILQQQNQKIQNAIYECLSDLSQPSLQSFIKSLQQECGITLKTIIQIVRQMTKNKDVQKILKQNLIKCWIKCEVYSLRKFNKKTREKIAEVIDKYHFKGSSLDQVLHQINENISVQQIIKIKYILLKDHSDKINSLFSEQIILPTISQDPNKNIPQRLKDMLSDYDFFPPNYQEKDTNKPDSLQKQIEKELIISFVQMHSLSSKLQGHRLKGLHNQIGQLQTKIIRSGQRNAKTQELIKKLKLNPSPYQKYVLLSSLKSRLFGINVLQLQRLICNTLHSKHKIKDRNVILLLGSTGSGKTTTILKLFGYKLKKVLYRGLQTLIPQNLKIQHKTFVASPQCTSITRYLNVAEVPEEMYSKYTHKSKRNYCIADSPGFFDTSGIQVEIANKIGVLTGLSQCNSLVILVIIPYETITADRGQGLINISEATSNLFKDFQECKSSILFMFNKVSQENTKEIPIHIKSKMDNLSHGQNRDIIKSILSHMMQCSKEKDNFIFPIQTKVPQNQTNFKGVLERLFKMDKITDPKQALRNGFTKSMINQVKSFALSKKQRIQYCIEEGKINEAKFYYDLIVKMKNIFDGNDDFLDQILQKLEVYFAKKNEFWMENLSKGIQLLIQNKLSTKCVSEVKQNRKNVIQFSHYFNKDDYSKQLQFMITSQKQQFHQLLIIQKNDSIPLFKQIQTFSNIFIPELQNIFTEMIEKQLLEQFKSIHYSILAKKTEQLSKSIPILLKSIKIYNNFKTSVEIQQKLNSIIILIQQLFNNYLKQIKQLIDDKKLVLTDRYITLISTIFSKLEQLQSLKIIKKIDTKKSINSFLKSYESRVKQNLIIAQNLMNNLLQKQPNQLNAVPSAQVKQIKSILKQIFMNLNFQPLCKEFNEEIRNVKQQILQELDESLNVLCSFVNNIKYDKIKNIKDKLGFVKNHYYALVKICEIIQEKRPIQQINSIISQKIMEIIQYLAKLIDLLEVKFSPLLRDNVEKSKQYFQVIVSLQTLNDISQQLNNKIQQLRTNFIKRLQLPLSDFLQFIDKSLTISNQYIFSSLIFEKIQRFCFYSLEVSKILSHKDRSLFNQHEQNIEEKLQSFMVELKMKIGSFLESTFHDPSEIKLMKQYMRSIIRLNQKQPTKIYLSNIIGIQTAVIRQAIRQKLDDIINNITKNFEELTSQTFVIGEILKLSDECKKYIIIEEVIQIKKERLYLKELLDKINNYMSTHINIDKETAIFHIKGNKPSNINFYQVNIINERLTFWNNAEGNQKKIKIYNQIRNIQRQMLGLLKNIRMEMGKQIEEEKINRHQFAEYFESFNEAIILQKQLSKLYKQTKQFQISISIQQTAKIIISYFRNLYQNILQHFLQFRLNKISTTIVTIAFIQYQLNEQQYFNPQSDEEQIQPNRYQIIKTLRQFTNTAISQIKQKIDTFGQSTMLLSSVSFHNVNLRRYLQIWQQKLQQYLQNKYSQYSIEFKPDEMLKKYYINNFSDPKQINTYQLQQKKQQTDKNIQSYFDSLQQNYQESQEEHRKAIQKQWQDSLFYLPSIIKQKYKEQLRQIKQSVKMQNNLSTLLATKAFSVEKQDESFEEIVLRFTNQYYTQNADSFLEEVQKTQFFGNKCLMLKKGIDLEAFNNQASSFFTQIRQTQFFVRQFKRQLKKNQNIIDQFLKNYQDLQKKMKNNQSMPTLKKKLSFW